MMKSILSIGLVAILGTTTAWAEGGNGRYWEKKNAKNQDPCKNNSIITFIKGKSVNCGQKQSINDEVPTAKQVQIENPVYGNGATPTPKKRKNLFATLKNLFIPKSQRKKDKSQEVALPQAQQEAEIIAQTRLGEEVVEDNDIDAEDIADSVMADTPSIQDINQNVLEIVAMEIQKGKRVIAVVDKSIRSKENPDAQMMKIWYDGNWIVTGWDVSTGREKQEISKSGRYYFTATPMRIMTPQGAATAVREMKLEDGSTKEIPTHWSRTWQAWMDYPVFIRGGVAIHATTPDHYAELGRRASGGCIRLHPRHAEKFYYLVESVGLSEVSVIVHNNGQVRL